MSKLPDAAVEGTQMDPADLEYGGGRAPAVNSTDRATAGQNRPAPPQTGTILQVVACSYAALNGHRGP
ncbi:MAG: hypothetical protein DI630_24925 [Gordonia sp. (in: high G+C Gram-positive bacteria)]|nr:MAG: hypothetical protein DI630_24925 [Gordonia sp. (in: high G+C Gram-positive bacteria)]